MPNLLEGFARWRELGPKEGTLAVGRLLADRAQEPGRRIRIQVAPIRVKPGEVRTALGDASAEEILRGRVLRAFPTVARWEESLSSLDPADKESLLERAKNVLEHRFDLLGSGPLDLGPKIDWYRDFKSGRVWPNAHISKIQISYPDSSDIKVPWELSRFQHLPLLSAAYLLTGDEMWLEEVGAQLDDWIQKNPIEVGPNWACTMDVAIRASNWIATLALCAQQTSRFPWFDRAIASLLLHGRFIRSHLETGAVRGNHYLSDIVGLLPVSALFFDGREGREWADWAAEELVCEMEHQVREDGCDHEASISYHRLVTELFICGTQVVDELFPNQLPAEYRVRLQRMLRFVGDYTRPDGLAPQVGDADDGRFLPLGDYGRGDFQSHLHLFDQAGVEYSAQSADADYPESGWYIMRSSRLYMLIRCGDTGLRGLGGHAHNDQLSFELCVDDQPVIIDPGAYIYTADPTARNLFRSTAFHATLCIDDMEQNELQSDHLFSLHDRSQAQRLEWQTDAERAIFAGRHHGFSVLRSPAIHTRRFELTRSANELSIQDTVHGDGKHKLEWTFPLIPNARIRVFDSSAEVSVGSVSIQLESTGLKFATEYGWVSPRYGVRQATQFLRARRLSSPGTDLTEFFLTVK